MTGHPVYEAYAAALDSPCPTCGASAGEYCTRVDGNRARRVRRCPCVRRPMRLNAQEVDEPRRPSRSFSEPLRGES